MVMTARVYPDMSNADYHAAPGLSASGAKMLLPPSTPAQYKYAREHATYKDIYDFGSAAHKVALDSDDVLEVIDAERWTGDAKIRRDEARAAGRIPIKAKDYAHIITMAEQIRRHPLASWLLDQPGKPEQSVFWDDERTGVPLRCKLDKMPDAAPWTVYIAEYKSTNAADLESFSRTVRNLNYHVQTAFQLEAARQAGLDDVKFLWIAQEKTPPYLVGVYELSPFDLDIGNKLMRQAIDIYAECTTNDEWPGYPSEVQTVEFPAWYVEQFEEEMRI